MLPRLTVPAWEKTIPGLLHGFLGRGGGVSVAVFAELNLSVRVGDADGAVRENWRRVRHMVGDEMQVATMRQVHGAEVATVSPAASDAGEADALVAQEPGVVLSVLTADCVPLLLVAPREHVVAAVHAGWRGTLGGVAVRTIEHLTTRFGVDPAGLYAALGPAIGSCCFEVDREIAESMQARWGDVPDAVLPGKHKAKAYLDLRRANAALLTRAGVSVDRIVSVGPCTRCATHQYFSHRAAGGTTGRQLSFIGWRA